ncbi:MAG TPA: hypothetical protein VFL71_21420 [Actinomycetes bacterium]|jgi:hypothetical protein|nr:hypothetical protein [Actinomycetes bacterium]
MGPDTNETPDLVGPGDEALLEELRGAAHRFDPPPPAVLEAARASLTWRTIDAELAALEFDSAVDQAAAAVRSGEGPRLLTFSAPGLNIEVEVSPLGPRRQLVGQLVPAQAARIDVRHAGGVTTVQADQLGRFGVDAVSAGPVSLRCHLATVPPSPPVVTEWIPL